MSCLHHGVRVLLLLAASLFLCGCKGHWEDYEKILGYRGKARLNPFLAAERLLNELGHDVRSVKSLHSLPDHEAVLFISGEGSLPEGRARQLLSWVYSGGHVIYCMGGTQPYNDFDSQFGSFLSSILLEEQEDPMLERLGVGVKKRFNADEVKDLFSERKKDKGKKKKSESEAKKDDTSKAEPPKDAAPKEDAPKNEAPKDELPKELKKNATDEKKPNKKDDEWMESVVQVGWNEENYQISLGGHLQLSLDRPLRSGEFSAGPKDKALALHLHHGMGQVTLLTHARPFRNRWIGERDHARWLSALVGEGREREVLIVAAASGSFFGLLWQHGWIALLALAVFLVFWLWRQMPRFGPLVEVKLDSTRHFASHIGALGEFFWRMRRGALLVHAARESVWERLRERHRSLDDGSKQMSDTLAEAIAMRTGLSAVRVAAAFDAAPPTNAHHFVLMMRDLQTIRRSL